MSKAGYRKLTGQTGVYKHQKTKNYLVIKKIKGIVHQKTFDNLFEAKRWRASFDGKDEIIVESKFSTLKEVWMMMQKVHFPNLATTTQAIWHRRYGPWKKLEKLPMDEITPSKVTSFVQNLATHFRSDFYQNSGRGKASRCNLNNELNLFVTIFNWYKESEEFEKEAMSLTNPIKKKHKKMGFIKPVPDRRKKITLDHAITFFEHLEPIYSDLAQMQFYTAGRVGEVSGLQWSNIDLANKRMLIKHSCIWCMTKKTFIELKPFPKNKEARAVYITDEINEVLNSRLAFKQKGNDYVFHIDGRPLNYGTIQVNYKKAQTRGNLPYSGTHILRHGMAVLARRVGGGLDAVIAMTGHKDIKLADHYSKCDEEDQKDVSLKIMQYIRDQKKSNKTEDTPDNVIELFSQKLSAN
jgi:integrase